MKRLKLTNVEKYALVDDEDHEKCKAYKWSENQGAIQAWVGQRTTLANYVMKSDQMFDHKDRDFLNNQKRNLRLCNHSQNGINHVKKSNTTSQYKGVTWQKSNNKWQVQIRANGKQLWLGYFKSEIVAAKVYDKKAKELHGEFAVLNFPEQE